VREGREQGYTLRQEARKKGNKEEERIQAAVATNDLGLTLLQGNILKHHAGLVFV